MSREQEPFVRVYYRKLQKEYKRVLYHPSAFATYVRLLIVADQAWPAEPVLPRGTSRSDLALLAEGDLVMVADHGIYTIRGYAKDRAKREAAGRAGAEARWSDRNANALPSQSDRNANTSTSTNTSTRPEIHKAVEEEGHRRPQRLVEPVGRTA